MIIFDMDNSISLVSQIHSLTQDFLTTKLSEKGLENFATSHGNILFQLSRVDFMTLSELTVAINRDKSTTTVLVRKLENAGLVELKASATDGRSKLISLTAKGKEYNQITGNLSKELQETFYKGFTENEKEVFRNTLLRIKENLV